MKHTHLSNIMAILSIFLGVCIHDTALAQGTAQQTTSVTEGYAGTAIPIDITIKDATEWEPPVMPAIDGLNIERITGNQSSMTRIANGVRTDSTQITYTFAVVAEEPGTYEIPSFPILVDGQTLQSRPVTLTFRPSENHGLLRAEVSGNPNRIIQGESTTLTLQIMVKQFTDSTYNVSPDAREMWSLIDANSDWGPFTETMIDLYTNRRVPRGRAQTLRDENGNRENYYLYDIQAEVRPVATGPLDVSDITIRINYPVSLLRERSFFGPSLKIDQVRPISTEATCRGVEVLPLPAEGRPPLFNGAVGKFEITTTASPTTVAVGDPITLIMTITDKGETAFDMDVLPAPELDKMPELERDFRVPREDLAGVVNGRRKTFTQTIRARRDDVTSIPPLSYAFFDPRQDTYSTSESRPILLEVSPSETINSSDIAGAVNKMPGNNLHSVSGGILANYTGADRLLANSEEPGTLWLLILLLTPPLAIIAIAGARHGMRGHLADPERIRSRRAGRQSLITLSSVSNMPESSQPAAIIEAICTYVADRTGQTPAGFMRGDAIATLRSCNTDEPLVHEVDQLISQCELLQYAGGGTGDIANLTRTAEAMITRLEAVDTLKTSQKACQS
ncbi:MAG: hypothetical protein CMJ39_11045 [Phycisphaerae bacterium]|nr:hypothetical protein [Phycisphaerae bacterium]